MGHQSILCVMPSAAAKKRRAAQSTGSRRKPRAKREPLGTTAREDAWLRELAASGDVVIPPGWGKKKLPVRKSVVIPGPPLWEDIVANRR